MTRVLQISAAATCVWIAIPTSAQPDPRIDEHTGADLANYPPPRHFDHDHMTLELDIPDMSKRRLTGRQTLTMRAVGRDRRVVSLDAVGLDIRSVSVGARAQPFIHDGRDLVVNLDRPVEQGASIDLVIEYAGYFPRVTGTGLTWTRGNPDKASLTDRSPQIHTQGQTEFNSHWFPCHDSPNEQLTSELIVTVDSDFQVCSNGRLESKSTGEDGRTTWRWLQDKPHSTYLVTLVVGRFALIGLDWDRDDIPLTVYAPVGFTERMTEKFSVTGPMIEFFEQRFDEPYPWDKYAQLVVRDFAAGAMENTSASTFQQPMSLYDDIEAVIAHEIAHQWFGDLVAYKAWEHLWLGEGWATYSEALWAEHKGGRDAYDEVIVANLSMSRLAATPAPYAPGLASKYFTDAEEAFSKRDDPYSKGAMVLHMLRMQLGDETFFKATAEFIDRFKYRCAETDDFRRVFEDVSGRSFECFFRQWVEQPGTPRLAIELEWEAGVLTIRAEQTQTINAANPAYDLDLPFEIEFHDGARRTVHLPMQTRTVEAEYTLDEPAGVTFDPQLHIAAQARITKPLAMWRRQRESGSTAVARARAAEHLALIEGDRAAAEDRP